MNREFEKGIAADRYALAVIDVLAGDFPDLRDPVIALIARKYILGHMLNGDVLEVLVDDPFTANWRLIGGHGGVRLACWRLNPTDADRERMERLNAAIGALGTSEEAQR